MHKKLLISVAAAFLSGIIVAVVYWAFTNLVEEVQHLLWFNLGNTETYAWMAIILGAIGGVTLSWLLQFFKDRGHQDVGHKIEDYIKYDGLDIKWVIRMLAIGFVSLSLGASLGPEAVLIPVSYGLVFLLAKRLKLDNPRNFGIFGIVALLGAFFNTAYAGLVVIGVAMANKKSDKKTIISTLIIGSVAVAGTLITLYLLRLKHGYINADFAKDLNFKLEYVLLAALISFITFFVPYALNWTIKMVAPIFDYIKNKHWFYRGLTAGAVLGVLYFFMGPVGYFSGHEGIPELLHSYNDYTNLQLLLLAIAKITVTAWSVATIYKGGTIFPLLFVAVCLILALSSNGPSSAVVVALLAATFYGVFVGSLGSQFIALAFILSIFGIEVWPVALAAAAGSIAAQRMISKNGSSKSVI